MLNIEATSRKRLPGHLKVFFLCSKFNLLDAQKAHHAQLQEACNQLAAIMQLLEATPREEGPKDESLNTSSGPSSSETLSSEGELKNKAGPTLNDAEIEDCKELLKELRESLSTATNRIESEVRTICAYGSNVIVG